MKKTIFALTLILSLALSACGGAVTETATSGLNVDYENALGLQLQLSIGTFNLEETDLAVDTAQAADLLPLWQVLKSLNESGSAAPEEIDALIVQIEETMTPEQIEAIAAMKLTREDMGVVMQEYGLTMGDGEVPEGFTPGAGGGPGGGSGVPGLSGGGPGETGMSPEEIATMQAEREKNGGSMLNSRISGVILEGLIELLQSK